MATLLEASREPILRANRADVEASLSHLSSGMLDRLRLDEVRLSAIASQVLAMAKLPAVERCAARWRTADGLEVEERRVPVGVVGAVYEARPNVTADVVTQLVKSRNAGVLRTGGASIRTAAAMLDTAIAPALADAGVDAEAIGLVRAGGHKAAETLVSMPTLVPLVILRGSGQTTRHLAGIAAHGVRTLQHADGGGVLYIHAGADLDTAINLIRSGLDRLGVCNRLNWLLVDRSLYDSFLPCALDALGGLGVAASLPPHDHPLSHEWALDRERPATVTVLPVDGVDDALALAHRHTSQLAAAIVSDDEAAATRFLDGYRGRAGSGTPPPGGSTATGSLVPQRQASTSITFQGHEDRSPTATCTCGSTSSSPTAAAETPVRGEIVLIGPAGSGKSIQGRLVSVSLGLAHHDLDRVAWQYYGDAGFTAEEFDR